MNKIPEIESWINVSTSLMDRIISNYACKICGHVGKVTFDEILANEIMTSHPIELICESCQRDEKIEEILKY
jgi:hypothetical protein